MESEVLIALLLKYVEDRLESIPQASVGPRGHRGPSGSPGNDGKDFVFSEHEGAIRAWAKEYALKFSDLSTEEKDSLKGRDGKDGANFVFEAHREEIEKSISDFIGGLDLKLKFSDLTEEEISDLRGPRGRDGKDGKGFVFEEHLEYFNSLKLKFSDLTAEERDALVLKFSQLTDEERASLKLRFEDLTDDDRALIRGPRGVRGQKGSPGKAGKDGEDGQSIRGLPGPCGVAGRSGLNGRDGIDGSAGQDAPYIVAIDVDQSRDKFTLIFHFSDGTSLETQTISLPSGATYIIGGGGGGGSGGGQAIEADTGPKGSFQLLNDTADQDVTGLIFGSDIRSAKVEWNVYRKSTGGGGQTRIQEGSFYVVYDGLFYELADLPASSLAAGVSFGVSATGQISVTTDDNGGTFVAETSVLYFTTVNYVPVTDSLTDDYTSHTLLDNTLAQKVPGLNFGWNRTRSAKVEWNVYRKSTGGGGQTRMQSGAFYVSYDGTSFSLTDLFQSSPPAGISFDVDPTTGEILLDADDNGGLFNPADSVLGFKTTRAVNFSGELLSGPSGEFIVSNNQTGQIVDGLSFGQPTSHYQVEWTVFRYSVGGQTRAQSGSFYALNNGVDWQLSDGPMSGTLAGVDTYIDPATGEVLLDSDLNGGTYVASNSVFIYRVVS